ncbi:MAG: hypothetical protein K0Q72_505, partial [Armatimonadetes bacterium]|nr:hypothetical protein [Armatimonadota bacterium]
AAALGSAVVVTVLITRRSGGAVAGEEVPEIIADCFDRIHRIETELRRLKPDVESLG